MKKPLVIIACLGALVTLSAFTLVLNSAGKIFYTGSPYDGSTCADCHSGGATIPAVSITASPAFGAGDTYTPATTYTINVTATGSYNKYGFDMEILDSNSPSTVNDAGTFGAMLSGNCQKFSFGPGNPTNITHTAPSGSAGSATFSFEWTAPAGGNVYMYTAVLGVNFNGANSGDRVKPYSYSLTPGGIGVAEQTGGGAQFSVFPNPASDRLTASYKLRHEANVQIALFSISGQHVCDLFNENQLPGVHSVELHIPASTVKGAYMLKLFVNGSAAIGKLVIL